MIVELRHLRAFLAIAQEGNVTRAAARLGIGQPALSRTLQQLERHLGLRLADRSTHHLTLTTAGRAFRSRAETAVAAVDAALDWTRAGRWPLRLGYSWSALGSRTTDLLRRWRHEHDDIPLELVRADDRTAGLATGQADVALVRGTARLPGARVEVLFDEERVAVLPADSPLAGADAVGLDDLADLTVALNPVSGTTTPALWPPDRRPATITVTSTEDWLVAIAEGRAVGVSAASTAEMHHFPGVVYVPLGDAPTLPVLLVWTDPPTHPAVGALVALAREIVDGAGPPAGSR